MITSVSRGRLEDRALAAPGRACSVIALEMLPLCAIAKPPQARSANSGWTLRRPGAAGGRIAHVARRPSCPGSSASSPAVEKIVRDVADARGGVRTRAPSKLVMPTASWPRCCRAWRPSAVDRRRRRARRSRRRCRIPRAACRRLRRGRDVVKFMRRARHSLRDGQWRLPASSIASCGRGIGEDMHARVRLPPRLVAAAYIAAAATPR